MSKLVAKRVFGTRLGAFWSAICAGNRRLLAQTFGFFAPVMVRICGFRVVSFFPVANWRME
jgi:hypothetical protein